MNLKTTYLLFGLVVLVLVGLGVAFYMNPSAPENSKFVFPSLNDSKVKADPGEVTRVEIARAGTGEKLDFVREDRAKPWRMNGFPADNTAVNNLVRHIYEAQMTESRPPRRLADWGLELPETVVTLERAGKPALTLKVGKATPGQDSSAVIYVISSERPTEPLAVPRADLEDVLKGPTAFRERDLVARNSTDLQKVELAYGIKLGAPDIGLVKNGADWRYTAPERCKGSAVETTGLALPPSDQPPTDISALLNDLTNIKVGGEKGDDFVADGVSDDDMARKYHLGPKDPKLFITFKRADDGGGTTEQTLVIGVGRKADKGGEKEPEKYYACIQGSNNVMRVPVKSVAPVRALAAAPDALRDRHIVKLDSSQKPDAVYLRNTHTEGKWLEFFKSAPPPQPALPPGHQSPPPGRWSMYRGSDQTPTDIREPVVTHLVDVLIGPNQVEGFPGNGVTASDLGLADEHQARAVVELWLDGIAPEEKKEEKDTRKDAKDQKKKDNEPKKEEKKPKPKLKESNKPTVRLIFGAPQYRENRATAGAATFASLSTPAGPLLAVPALLSGRTEENTYPVLRIEGTTRSLIYVKPVVYQAVTERLLDFMSKALPSFFDPANPTKSFAGVTRLQLVLRDGKDSREYVVVGEAGKQDKTWTIEKPADLKGRTADRRLVEGMLRSFGQLRYAESLESDKKPEEQDPLYNLGKKARVKATITVVTRVNDRDETRTYQYRFGKEKSQSLQYAWLDPPGMVVLVNRFLVSLRPKGLLDLTVFNFDTTNVTALKIEGWSNLKPKGKKTVEVTRTPTNNWVFKDEKVKEAASSFRIESLLGALYNLAADRIVAPTDPKPESGYEFDVARSGMVIEISVRGHPGPLKLTLGAAEGTNYYAVSPQLPGETFLVPKAPFEEMRKSADYFKD